MRPNNYSVEISEQFRQWESGKSSYLWRRRLEMVIPRLPARGAVLDAGCGDLQTIERLQAERPDLRFAAADIRETRPGSEIVRADCQRLPFAGGRFAGVLLLAVIEHVPDQAAALVEAHRVLAPGGTLILTTPNPLFGLPMAVAGRVGLKYREGYDNGVGLPRLRILASRAGLEVTEARGFLALPFATPLERLEPLVGGTPVLRRALMNQLLVARRPA